MKAFLRLAPALLIGFVGGCNFGSSSPAGDGGLESSIGSPSGLVASPPSESFGTVAVGATSAPVTVAFSNTGSGATGVLASTITGGNAAAFAVASDGCSGQTLATGQTCQVTVHFAPLAAGAQQANLTVADQHGSVAIVALTGQGASASPGALSVAPTTQDFGTLASGSKSAAVPFAFANHGGTATPPLAVSLTGPDASDFQLADPCSGKPLAAGASCQVTVTFAAAATGSKTASLAGTAQGLGTATASLSGTAAAGAAFAVTPGTYDFGSILVGTPTATQTFTVTNGGGVASGVPAVAITGANAADFVVSANQCTSALAGGAKCTFAVAFTAASPAAETATVTVSGTATTSGTAALTGTGLA
ncbi:MAG TPA: choice-of-anchor D domain-containing protein, partial [Polyangiaceae bacterium]